MSFHYYQEKKRSRKKAVEILRAKVKILKDLGHIRKNIVTQKGEFASRVYGYELLLSELYDDGTLERLSEVALGVLSIALVYEPRKGAMKPYIINKQIKNLEKLVDKSIGSIHKIEGNARIKPFSKKCYFHLAPAMEGWIKGKGFDSIVKESNADEGEVVRCFRMSIQILREILDAPVTEALKQKVHSLIGKINRDVVDSEKQLRS